MMSRLLLFSIAAGLIQLGSFCQFARCGSLELRGFIGLMVAESKAGEDFRIIRAVDPDSPAYNAGITRGDYIVSVDGRSTVDLKSAEELQNLLKGDPGTSVRLELLKAKSGRAETLIITRAERLLPTNP